MNQIFRSPRKRPCEHKDGVLFGRPTFCGRLTKRRVKTPDGNWFVICWRHRKDFK